MRKTKKGTFARRRTECRDCGYSYQVAKRSTPAGRTAVIMQGIKARTKRASLPTATVTATWVQKKIELGKCAVTGIPFELEDGEGTEKVNPYAPSADRKNPRKGYTYANTQIVVWAYNRAKGEYADSTFTRVARSYLEAKGYIVRDTRKGKL